MSTISDRLRRARQRDFVGREAEQAAFRAALEAEESPWLVLDVYGPGGVGKTALLWRLRSLAPEPCFHLDGEEVEPTPEAFQKALRGFENLPEDRPVVLLIDAFERLAALDGWLRATFLPQLPVNVLTVRASSLPPAAAWRADPGWSALHARMPLRNLDPSESRELLRRKGVPESHHDALLASSHGHPLALTLLADLVLRDPSADHSSPDVIGPLLERLLADCPGPEHRRALEACAVTPTMTEPLLAEKLGVEDARGWFGWLRGLPMVEISEGGLRLHDLVRQALTADLRWRDPGRLPAVAALSRADFEEAVAAALRSYADPELLEGNPVLGSRLVDGGGVEALRELLREAAESMRFSRRQLKFYNAVLHTYLEPAGTQEQVAERLDVPFSSYRRHLKAGVERVAEILWQRDAS